MSTNSAKWLVPFGVKTTAIAIQINELYGLRDISINGQNYLSKRSLFHFTGEETFQYEGVNYGIVTTKVDGSFEFKLKVNSMSFEDFFKMQDKRFEVFFWAFEFRIVLDKLTMSVMVNNEAVETRGEFDGSETITHFKIEDTPGRLIAVSTGRRDHPILHKLYMGHYLVAPIKIDE